MLLLCVVTQHDMVVVLPVAADFSCAPVLHYAQPPLFS
jgi:hypothetical protein